MATTGVGLVLLLTVLAASPAAHEHVHADAAHADHACAVVLYEQGLTSGFEIVVVLAAPEIAVQGRLLPARFVDLETPRYLHPPECGPPAELSIA